MRCTVRHSLPFRLHIEEYCHYWLLERRDGGDWVLNGCAVVLEQGVGKVESMRSALFGVY